MTEEPDDDLDIRPAESHLVRRQIGRHEVIEVRVSDLEALREAGTDAGQAASFCALFLGVLIPTLLSWASGADTALAGGLHAGISIAAGALAAFFGLKWWRAWRVGRVKFERMKSAANLMSEHPIGPPQG